MKHRVALLLAALWWGGMTALSMLVVPMLFAHLGNPVVAGGIAAKLFSIQTQAVLVLGLGLLVLLKRTEAWQQEQVPSSPEALAQQQSSMLTMGLVVLAMIAAIVQEFGVAHKIVSARASGGNLRLWHGVGTGLVLLKWLCGLFVFWRLTNERTKQADSGVSPA